MCLSRHFLGMRKVLLRAGRGGYGRQGREGQLTLRAIGGGHMEVNYRSFLKCIHV